MTPDLRAAELVPADHRMDEAGTITSPLHDPRGCSRIAAQDECSGSLCVSRKCSILARLEAL